MTDEDAAEAADSPDVIPAASNSLPAPLRLRSAGVGVIFGGVLLVLVSVGAPYWVAASLLVGIAVAGMLWSAGDTVLLQLFLGTGAVGGIGLLEALTGLGIGLGPLELGVIAVLFGGFDVCVGSVIHRFSLSGN